MTTSIGIIYTCAELVCQALDRLWAELSICAVEIMLQDGDGDVWWRCASSVDITVTRYNVMCDQSTACSDECKCQYRIQSKAAKQPAKVPEWASAKISQDIMWMKTSILGQKKTTCLLVAHCGNYFK